MINGAGGRRSWSADAKARILDETLAPGAVVSEVARRHGLTPQQVFGWRRQARRALASAAEAPVAFVPAVINRPLPEPPPAAPPRARRRRPAAAGIELEVGGGVVRVGANASGAAITAVIGR